MTVNRQFILETLSELVRINSVNPAFSGGATDERAIADAVAARLRGIGLDVRLIAPQPARPSVIGRLAGSGGGRSLILYAHMDTVAVDGMDDPFGATIRDGKLHGRGAYDMKGGLAACIGAVEALGRERGALGGDVYVVAVADEETESIGMQAVLDALRTDGAIVTEPTELELCLAHKGFSWITVETIGRAAHGSRYDLGVDANMRMGRVLAELETLDRTLRSSRRHPLLGPPSLHAALLRGGSGPSTYAPSCRLQIERRTIPGETEESVLAEIDAIVRRLAAADMTFEARVEPLVTREPFETAAEAPIVTVVRRAAAAVLRRTPRDVGQTPWMDAALLARHGIDTVVIGPAGAGAHADVEWVDIASVVALGEILVRAAHQYCR